MDSVNKTLYIPLYGKALVSRRGIILADSRAEELWAKEGFPLRGKSASKWLAFYMGMRSAVFDRWAEARIECSPGAVVLHIGCGLDSRFFRLGVRPGHWYDIDFPEVIAQRRLHYSEESGCSMLAGDAREAGWLGDIEGSEAIVLMEGISMYLAPAELEALLSRLTERFDKLSLLMDCYSGFAARMSKYKNPINDVGVRTVWGMDEPGALAEKCGFGRWQQLEMTPEELINQLSGVEKAIFRRLYAGKTAKKLYQLYEFEK